MEMIIFFHLIAIIRISECYDQGLSELKVKYLEDLVKKEVKKTETYKIRKNNNDLLGSIGNTKTIGEFLENV